MSPSPTGTLSQARSYLAALADHAPTDEASSAYEHLLIALDLLHHDQGPALDTDGVTDDPEVLHIVATSAIAELVSHGIDDLDVELLLAGLTDAHDLGTA